MSNTKHTHPAYERLHEVERERDAVLAALRDAYGTLAALRKHYHKEMSPGYRDFVTRAEDAARAAIAAATNHEDTTP